MLIYYEPLTEKFCPALEVLVLLNFMLIFTVAPEWSTRIFCCCVPWVMLNSLIQLCLRDAWVEVDLPGGSCNLGMGILQ